jgi:hypothetical protein
MFQINVVEKIETLIYVQNFYRKSCRLRDNVENYSRAGHATDENMEHAQCMLDT